VSVFVYCCRCDSVVPTEPIADRPLWCSTCSAEILGPPNPTGDRSVRWTPAGLSLAGEHEPSAAPARARTLGFAMLGAAMSATFELIYGRKDAPPAIEVHDDDPDDPDDLELHLDEESPKASWVRLRAHPPTSAS
jgi:hypothetical protein